MDDLARWYSDQLDADAELARAAADGDSGEWFMGDKWNVYRAEDETPHDDVEANRIVVYGNVKSQSEFIAAHDPARVLRDIEAKRKQLGWCVEVVGDRDLSRYGEPGLLKDDPDALAVTLAVEMLRLLALPYSDRPGYRPEWRP